jgi:hypothetical protein
LQHVRVDNFRLPLVRFGVHRLRKEMLHANFHHTQTIEKFLLATTKTLSEHRFLSLAQDC